MSPDAGSVVETSAAIRVRGKDYDALPEDLYIPPDALRVFLEMFEGPLDLLLYLIRKHDLDILDISIATITDQYLKYIEMMSSMRLQLAGDYLVMAATLAELKSRLMLPRQPDSEEDETDPRAELMRRLLEYEQIKQAATGLDELPRMDRDLFQAHVLAETESIELPPPEVSMADLVFAFAEVVQRSQLHQAHDITLEPLSVQEQKGLILNVLGKAGEFVDFSRLFDHSQGKRGLVYTFLALLLLLQERSVDVMQNRPNAKIYVRLSDDQ